MNSEKKRKDQAKRLGFKGWLVLFDMRSLRLCVKLLSWTSQGLLCADAPVAIVQLKPALKHHSLGKSELLSIKTKSVKRCVLSMALVSLDENQDAKLWRKGCGCEGTRRCETQYNSKFSTTVHIASTFWRGCPAALIRFHDSTKIKVIWLWKNDLTWQITDVLPLKIVGWSIGTWKVARWATEKVAKLSQQWLAQQFTVVYHHRPLFPDAPWEKIPTCGSFLGYM